MHPQDQISEALQWNELIRLAPKDFDNLNGPTNSYSLLRLFEQPEESIRITLYRDHHAWCPYCQKVWLWLEFKKLPYKVRKVTMNCYGKKERFYLNKVASGMLPAIEIDNQLITESDEILLALENTFGPLGKILNDENNLRLRNLERYLFRSWCIWLCTPRLSQTQEEKCKEQFQRIANELENELSKEEGPWLDSTFSSQKQSIPGSIDIIFIPYLERMNASLAYYKGLNLRKEHPLIDKWFKALEKLPTYLGTQGDFHTHAHDLPPQMGGCWTHANPNQKLLSKAIDSGQGLGEIELNISDVKQFSLHSPEEIALARVIKHRKNIIQSNPIKNNLFDQPLRAALSRMITGKTYFPDKNSASGLRYLKDRISVPRDMPLLSARKFRQALEITAELDGNQQGPPIQTKNRYDQNPASFL